MASRTKGYSTNVRTLREAMGLSVNQLAEKSGVGPSIIRLIELGNMPVDGERRRRDRTTINKRAALARALGVEPDKIKCIKFEQPVGADTLSRAGMLQVWKLMQYLLAFGHPELTLTEFVGIAGAVYSKQVYDKKRPAAEPLTKQELRAVIDEYLAKNTTSGASTS